MARQPKTVERSANAAYFQDRTDKAPKLEAAEIKLDVDGNRIEGPFKLFGVARFNEIHVVGQSLNEYVVKISVAFLNLKLESISEVRSSKRYRYEIGKRDFRNSENAETSYRHGGSMKLAAKAGPFALNVEGNRGSKGRSEHRESVAFEGKVALVAPLANFQWRIGCKDHGDPRHSGSYLDSEYLNELGEPLVMLEVDQGSASASISATLSTRREHFDVFKVRDAPYGKKISEGDESDFGAALQAELVRLKLMASLEVSEAFVLARDHVKLARMPEEEL